MATLNYQLYRSTPPEKYATMFLGSYDAPARTLTYSNAGHLPPYVIARRWQRDRNWTPPEPWSACSTA